MLTVSSFMDESGKFQDHEIVAVGFVARLNTVPGFVDEWAYWLKQHGLEFLEAKEALRLHRPLSQKFPAHMAPERIDALSPFMKCIRRHLHMIGGVAIDVKEYRDIPEEYRRIWSDNPCYTAFARGVLEILRDSPKDGIISLYCDDEEQTALPFYQLYRKIKIQYEDARNRMKGITFADDRLVFALQAADLISSLIRQEALLRFRGREYELKPLYAFLEQQPAAWEQIRRAGVAWSSQARRGIQECEARSPPPSTR